MKWFLLLFFVVTPALVAASEKNTDPNEPSDTSSVSPAVQDSVMFRPDSGASSDLKWYTMFQRIPGDWITYGDRTFREDKIPAIIGVTALTAFGIWTDQPVWEASDRWYKSSHFVKKASDFFVYLGDGTPQFGLAAVFGAYGVLWKDQRAMRTGSQIVETILATGIVIQTLKHITGRESPFVSTRTNGRWVFFPDQVQYHKKVPHYDAFPSGHIATATATLVVVSENYPELKPWLIPAGYVVVGLIGVGLSNTGIHWWSDFPLGIALGYEFGMIAAHPEGLDLVKSDSGDKPRLSVLPDISPIRQGVTLSLSF